MEEEKITLPLGGKHGLFIPNRGSSGLQLVFEVTDTSVIDVQRTELPRDASQISGLKPGDPLPAYFVVKGINRGKSKLTFGEKRVGMPDSPNLFVRSYMIDVE